MLQEAAASPLTAWQSFYVIVGSSGAALIGLQFVVIALIAQVAMRSSHASIGAFGTPTIVHFAAAFLVSATLSAPWPSLWPAGVVLKLLGFAGVVYTAINIRRTRRQTVYQPVWEDWLWHSIFPLTAYAILLIAPFILRWRLTGALFAIAAAAIMFLLVGIHNSWDTVTFIVVQRGPGTNATTTDEA